MDLQLAEAITPDDLDAHRDRVAELKLDGVRIYTEGGRLYTRRGNDVTASFPEIDAPEAHVLDGEVLCITGGFDATLRRVQTEKPFAVEMLSERHPAHLWVFDALRINDGDVRDRPLLDRKELIPPSLPSDANIHYLDHADDVLDLWDQATDEGREGIMLKDPEATYEAGRGRNWLKLKDWKEATFPVVGHEHTDNDGFVIFVDIGTDEPQKVVVNGHDDQRAVEAGIDAAEIQYLERSVNNRLRKPSFRGVAA